MGVQTFDEQETTRVPRPPGGTRMPTGPREAPPERDVRTTLIGIEAHLASMASEPVTIERAWSVGKTVAVIAVFVFGAGGAWALWHEANATTEDVAEALAPINALDTAQDGRLDQLTEDVGEVTKAVGTLVEGAAGEREIRGRCRVLAGHRADYAERLAEYGAARQAGRRVGKPGKSDAHVELAAALGDSC